jgi:copper chaperone
MASLRLVENLKEATPMQVFNVQGMTCGHCVKAVTRAVQEQDAAAKVEIDLAARQVRVQSELGQEQILTAIRDEGYQAELA